MDEMTQQNAALVEQAAAAAESMEEQAAGLARAVSAFKLDHSGMERKPHVVKKSSGSGSSRGGEPRSGRANKALRTLKFDK
jgi:hypothetical protein